MGLQVAHEGAVSLEECKLVELPKIKDPRGNLTFLEGGRHVTFSIKRVYYLYDVPGGETRGGHAHRKLEQFIIAVNGSFEVVVDNGHSRKSHRLWRADQGLYICPGIWRELQNFTSGSVCLVLASELFDERDYLREYSGFLDAVRRGLFSA